MNIDEAIEAGEVAEVQSLLNQGLDFDKMGKYDSTPLANAAALGNLEIVDLLLIARADPNWGGCRIPLGIAAGRGHSDVVYTLLEYGADPNKQDLQGNTALHMAVSSGKPGIVKALVKAGADLNIQNNMQQTPAMLARERSCPEIVQLLDTWDER